MSIRSAVAVLLAAALPACVPLPLLHHATTPQLPDCAAACGLAATRSQLEARLAALRAPELARRSPGLVAAETTSIERRLAEGDFRTGDRILLAVEDPLPVDLPPERPGPGPVAKTQEQQLSDTFTVGAGGEIVLPSVGRVALHGILRSELETHLSRMIGRAIRNPVVHAQPLVTLGVTGEVTRAGYYALPPDALVSTLLNAAGGPTKDARVSKLEIARDGKAMWKGDELRRAMGAGRTLDQLGLQSGDVLVVPVNKHALEDLYRPLQFVALLGTISLAIYEISTHIAF